MDTPILLIHFNRPKMTHRQIQALAMIKPKRIWVLSDGARANRPDEADQVEAVRAQFKCLPWPCEVNRLFREVNLGVYRNISEGISWFFEQVDRGIILEDDCLPNPSFFPFCEDLLERYSESERVFAISGYTGKSKDLPIEDSYCFSNYFSCWGWATWKRAWEHFDPDITAFTDPSIWKRIETNILCGIRQRYYWRMICRRLIRGSCDSWAYRFQLSLWKSGGVAVIPRVSLVVNYGFGEEATNTKGLTHFGAGQAEMKFPLSHPDTIQVERRVDHWIENHWHSKSLPVRLGWLKSKISQAVRNR